MFISAHLVCINSTHNRVLTVVLMAVCLAVCIALPQAVQAQDQCAELETNEQWNEGIKKLNELINTEKYDEALALSREIYPICPKSPLLNYFIAEGLKHTGDPVKATQFYQAASDNTFTIATVPQIAQKIWYARYESEYPERSGESVKALQDRADALQSSNKDLEGKNQALREEKEALESKNHDLELQLSRADAALEQSHTDIAIGMWTGVGIGALGLVLSGAFGYLAMVGNETRPVKINPAGENGLTAEFNGEAAAYWGVFGAGVALVVAGSAVAGVFGYRYTHPRTKNELAFSVTPTSASLSLTF